MEGEVQWVSDREIRWQVPFAALDGKKYRVDIFSEGWVWEPEVLKGAATPFYTQEDDDEDVFLPIRTCSGYLTIIVENQSLVDQIIAHDEHDRYVELVDVTDANNEVCVWNGFLAPDQYSGTWDRPPYELQLPLLSPLEAAKATRFQPSESMVTVHSLLNTIFSNYVEVHPDYLWFAVLDEDTPDMVPFLAAVLTDHIFLPEDEGEDKPVYGTTPLPPLKSNCFSATDVLEALCRAFGYIIYETPGNLYFAAPDKTNVYRKVAWSSLSSNGYEVVTLSNHQFPTIAGNEHSRTLVPGKSMVRVNCNLEELEKLYAVDLSICEVIRPGKSFRPNGDNPGCIEYMRYNNRYTSWQYVNNPPGSVPESNMLNVQWENYGQNERRYVGGNWVNYGEVPSASVSDFLNYEFPDNEALIITTCASDYGDGKLLAGEIVSPKKYSAINLQNGLEVNFTANFSKSFENYNFSDELSNKYIQIYCMLKWGNYYYQHDVGRTRNAPRQQGDPWGLAPHIFAMGLGSTDNKEFHPFHSDGLGAHFQIPDDMFDELQGNITLTFYTFAETQGVKVFRIKDLSISHGDRYIRQPVPVATDYSLIDFRRSLSTFRLSEYSYKQKLSTYGIAWSLSGVLTDEPLTDTSYEQLLLSRLATWYDRTIEQLMVTVENEDVEPGARIVRGTDKYIVVSRTRDWRNGRQILTIQKMYDEQQ